MAERPLPKRQVMRDCQSYLNPRLYEYEVFGYNWVVIRNSSWGHVHIDYWDWEEGRIYEFFDSQSTEGLEEIFGRRWDRVTLRTLYKKAM